ncbi:hypothetical protein [Actinoplanes sp. CA-252034]|uniref:hypothetical protein n=1 Tax=Actinoplanes sp. CA-252034 TaxID=3239906 RepID=UPI003D9766AD
MDHVRWRFDGWIAGMGTTGGTRLVVGHWPGSPFGPVTDVMVERPDGHRLLLAETAELAGFVAETYSFDEVRVVPITVDRSPRDWTVSAGPLQLRFTTGGRGMLGNLLHAVPVPLAQNLLWVRLIDLPARLLRGVRTFGSAGNGRREWYAVRDLHHVTAAGAVLDGADLGDLAPVDPPVRFGFGSAPRSPALVRITTTVEVPRP